MNIIIQIGLGLALGLWLVQLPKRFREWRQLRWVESRIVKLDEAPKVPLFRRVVACLKSELDLLGYYRYSRHMLGSRRLF